MITFNITVVGEGESMGMRVLHIYIYIYHMPSSSFWFRLMHKYYSRSVLNNELVLDGDHEPVNGRVIEPVFPSKTNKH